LPHFAILRNPPAPLPLLGAVLGWTWAWWALAAALGGVEGPGAAAWFAGAAGAPLAVLVVVRRSDPASRRDFLRRLVAVRAVPARWWLAALVVGAGPKVVALATTALAGHATEGESVGLGAVPAVVLFLLVAVWIEEPLWRGVALDSAMRRGRGAATAALGIGVAWALWHVPLFWLEGTYQHDLGVGTGRFWTFLGVVLAQSVLLTWLVVGGANAVSLAVAAHFLGNLVGELSAADDTVHLVELVVTALAAAVLLATRDRWAWVGSELPPPARTTLPVDPGR
jgi:uncharacterized protein